MAKMKSSADKFANIAAINAVEAVAGTTAYARFNFPFSIMDKVGLIISRIEYWPYNLSNLNSSTDTLTAALIAASAILDLTNQADPAMLDSFRIIRNDLGAAATGALERLPIIKDFSDIPGGGILCAPSPLNVAVQGVGGAGVVGCWVKLFYTYVEMTTDEYWEMVESRRIISS
jgi:hypothetical protein